MHTIILNSDMRGLKENITDCGHLHEHKDTLKRISKKEMLY